MVLAACMCVCVPLCHYMSLKIIIINSGESEGPKLMPTVVCTQTSRYNFQMYDARPQPNGTKSHLFNQGTSGMYQRSCKVVYFLPIKFHTYRDQITITGTYDLMSEFRCYRIKNLLTFDDQSISILYLVSSHQEYITDRVVVNQCTMSNLRPKAATWNTSWSPSSKRDLHQRCGGKVKVFLGDRAMWMRCVCWEVLFFFNAVDQFDIIWSCSRSDFSR